MDILGWKQSNSVHEKPVAAYSCALGDTICDAFLHALRPRRHKVPHILQVSLSWSNPRNGIDPPLVAGIGQAGRSHSGSPGPRASRDGQTDPINSYL